MMVSAWHWEIIPMGLRAGWLAEDVFSRMFTTTRVLTAPPASQTVLKHSARTCSVSATYPPGPGPG